MATIETRIHRSFLPDEQQEILNKLPTYTELEAEEVILYILENQVPSDPKDQYKQMVRNGMFK